MKNLSLCLFCLLAACRTQQPPLSVESAAAPKAIGPYSQAVVSGRFIFCSGQIGLVPETGVLAGDDIQVQARQALKNLEAIVKSAGSDLRGVVKVTVFVTDLNNYAAVNEVYAAFFKDNKPARSAVQVARLPKDALIEIDCIAVKK